jgi:hypothetical protein
MLSFKISKAAEMSFDINTKEFSDIYVTFKDFIIDKKQVAKIFGVPSKYVIEVPRLGD